MCLFSGENDSPFCWAGEKRSGFLFDSRAENCVSYLRTKTAGGVKVDFFAPCVRARHLELGHFSRREQKGRARGEREIEMGVVRGFCSLMRYISGSVCVSL